MPDGVNGCDGVKVSKTLTVGVRAYGWLRSLTPLLLVAAPAHADRGVHGSAGAGGSLLLTGGNGDRGRLDVEVDLKPRSRFGGLIAWRAFDEDHQGLVCAGLLYEGAAARPRLVLDLHADLGADLDAKAPLVGGGIRTTLTIAGPLGVALDTIAYLVIDGVDHSRVVVSTIAMIALRW
jgi:hypothetical protein